MNHKLLNKAIILLFYIRGLKGTYLNTETAVICKCCDSPLPLKCTLRPCDNCTYLNSNHSTECKVCRATLPFCPKIINNGQRLVKGSYECNKLSKQDYQVLKQKNDVLARQTYNVGIVELLDQALTIARNREKEIDKSEYRLCSPCTHVSQKGTEGFDWSCGYRNIEMLCSSLVKHPEYKACLFDGSGNIPSVHGIQSWIEKAW